MSSKTVTKTKVATRSIAPAKPTREELKAKREEAKKAYREQKQREKEQRAEQKKREKELRAWQKEQDKKNAAALLESAKKREGANYDRYSKALKAAYLFVAKEDNARPILQGVLHTADGDLIATDSCRLIWLEKVHSVEDTKIISKTEVIDGRYPDVRRIIPQPEHRDAIISRVDVNEWMNAHDQMYTLAEGTVNHVVRLTGLPSGMPIIETKDAELQTAKYTFEKLSLIGKKIDIAYNCGYMMDVMKALKTIGVKTCSIEFHGKKSPIVFRFDGGLALVLPVRTY